MGGIYKPLAKIERSKPKKKPENKPKQEPEHPKEEKKEGCQLSKILATTAVGLMLWFGCQAIRRQPQPTPSPTPAQVVMQPTATNTAMPSPTYTLTLPPTLTPTPKPTPVVIQVPVEVLAGKNISALAVDSHNTIYAGISGEQSGIFKLINGEWKDSSNGLQFVESNPNLYDITIDPNDSSTLYAITSAGIFKSHNNGDYWEQLISLTYKDKDTKITPPQLEIDNNGEIYVSFLPVDSCDWKNPACVYKSKDGGRTWEAVYTGNPEITSMALSPTNSTLYLGVATSYGKLIKIEREAEKDKIFWNKLVDGIKNICVDAKGETVYLTTDNVIYRVDSEISGVWKPWDIKDSNGYKDRNVDMLDLLCSPNDEKSIYVAYEVRGKFGIARTQNRGDTWELLGTAFDRINDLVLSSDYSKLYAATEGGIWMYDLAR